MLKYIIFLAFLISCSGFLTQAFSLEVELQKESERIIESMGMLRPESESFHEQFQLIFDTVEKKNRISIGLLSTSTNDIVFTDEIENISTDPRIISYSITNQFACAPNAIEKACIIIVVQREGMGSSVEEIRENVLEVTDKFLVDGVVAFKPEFDSITLQSKANYSGTEKMVVAQAIYTIHRQPTNELFTALSSMFLSSEVRTSGGFYSHAEKLSEHYFSEFTAVLVPGETNSLRSLHIALTCSDDISELPRCSSDGSVSKQIQSGIVYPLDFLQSESITRSAIFTDKFLPLNSVVQVLLFTDEDIQIKSVNSNLINQLNALDDLQKNGWFFASNSGQKIDARYIFGPTQSVDRNELSFSVGPNSGEDVMIIDTNDANDSGGCLIATAAFGSELAPQVQFLREIRDNTILQTESGASFMVGFNQFYYLFSPAVADYERENPAFKEAVKLTLTPLLTSLTLLQYVDIDSESEMLGYGISVILLNIGMYFVAPAVLIMKVKKKFN